jgi:hypothetical protein
LELRKMAEIADDLDRMHLMVHGIMIGLSAGTLAMGAYLESSTPKDCIGSKNLRVGTRALIVLGTIGLISSIGSMMCAIFCSGSSAGLSKKFVAYYWLLTLFIMIFTLVAKHGVAHSSMEDGKTSCWPQDSNPTKPSKALNNWLTILALISGLGMGVLTFVFFLMATEEAAPDIAVKAERRKQKLVAEAARDKQIHDKIKAAREEVESGRRAAALIRKQAQEEHEKSRTPEAIIAKRKADLEKDQATAAAAMKTRQDREHVRLIQQLDQAKRRLRRSPMQGEQRTRRQHSVNKAEERLQAFETKARDAQLELARKQQRQLYGGFGGGFDQGYP